MPRPCCCLLAATSEDLPGLAALERACFSHPWTTDQIQDALDREGVLLLKTPASEEWGGIVAYCIHALVLDELEIHTLAVAPAFRRLGFGRWLLGQVLTMAERRGASAAFLEVRQSNWQALALYSEAGFEIVGRRRGYYKAPSEDAFLLRRRSAEGRPLGPNDS